MAANAPCSRQIDRRHKREGAGDVQVDINEVAIVGAGVAAAKYQLVAACEPTQHAVAVSTWVPVETDARLEVIGISLGNRRESKTLVIAIGRDDRVVDRYEIVKVVARQFVAQAVGKREVRPDLPLVLRVVVGVVVVVVLDLLTSRQGTVDCRCRAGNIVNKGLQGRVGKSSTDRGNEEALNLRAAHVDAKLEGVIAVCPDEVVLYLVGVVVAKLRQVYRQSDGRCGC